MLSSIRLGLFAGILLLWMGSIPAFGQQRPAPLPPLDSLDVAAMGLIAVDLSNLAESMETGLKEKVPGLKEAQLLSANHFLLAKADSTVAKNVLDSLGRVAKSTKDIYKKSENMAEKAEKIKLFSRSLSNMDSLNLRKNLPKSWKQVYQLSEEVYPDTSAQKLGTDLAANGNSGKDKKKSAENSSGNAARTKRFAAYNPGNDVMLQPPVPPCTIAGSSRDEFSGEISRETARAELFRYTNPALKAYLQGKTHVICEASLASAGANATLLLTFHINDPNARKAFGRMEKNSIATLKFLDGTSFELQNAIADDGVFSPENDASIFHAQYPLNPEAFKKIRRTALDKIRILWSKGYDDYEVQQVDLLMRQAECLIK